MNYLLFNNEILVSDGVKVQRIDKNNDLKEILGTIEQVNLCVVDVDVLIAAAVEFPIEKKDSILVRKFKELYQHEAYIIQDEKIDNNLFQVIGIKEQKVREVYSVIPSEKIESFIPYGIALRHTLINNKVNLNKTVVFVDDLGSERLVTVFDGLKFSRTRSIANNGEDILPEIKRSQIDFFKKTEEFIVKNNADFCIIVNNQVLAAEISKNTEKLQVEYLNITYPGLEGLRAIDTLIKYRLPEENLRKRKEIELKKRVTTLIFSLCVVLAGTFYFLINKVQSGLIGSQFEMGNQIHGQLEAKLDKLDKETYRADLKIQKSLNYGIAYLSMLEIIPAGYTVNSFKIERSDKWNIEMTLFADEKGIYDPIPRIKILKNADIKDIFVNNQPGKLLKVTL